MNSTPETTPEPTPAPRFDLVGIVVSDMAATLAFYRRLGLDIPAGAEDEPHVEAVLPGGLRIAFDPEATIRSFHPGWQPPTGGGRIGLAFHCGTPQGVDAVFAELTAAGAPVELKPFDAPWGQRYATVLDPEGNGVDLFAPLAR
ncbi:VOC family protein [Streptomyces sp. NPDC050658]|uniref:VOC family protein n=1 Tax=unclassified Streptomyces TaxID=2593676 RepID=UPI0034124F9C